MQRSLRPLHPTRNQPPLVLSGNVKGRCNVENTLMMNLSITGSSEEGSERGDWY